jgi:hypothetical protein
VVVVLTDECKVDVVLQGFTVVVIVVGLGDSLDLIRVMVMVIVSSEECIGVWLDVRVDLWIDVWIDVRVDVCIDE